MLLIALLSTIGGALPIRPEPIGDPAHWVEASDIPQSQWSRATVTSFDLTIDSSGKPVSCTITNPSGSTIIDGIVCQSLMRNARYKPARDSSGIALPAVVRDHVQWHPNVNGDNRYLSNSPDIIVSSELAKSKSRYDIVKVVELIDAAGSVEACAAYKPSKIQRLNEIACEIAGRADISLPVRDGQGTPVRGVRAFNVGFFAGDVNHVQIR